MGKGKSDPGFNRSLNWTFSFNIWDDRLSSRQNFMTKLKAQIFYQTILSQPFGSWDEKWGKNIDFTAREKDNFAGYFVGFNSFLDFKSFFLVVGGVTCCYICCSTFSIIWKCICSWKGRISK